MRNANRMALATALLISIASGAPMTGSAGALTITVRAEESASGTAARNTGSTDGANNGNSAKPSSPRLGDGKLALNVPVASAQVSSAQTETPAPVQSADASADAENGPQSDESAYVGNYSGAVLSASAGRIYGPSGAETYYNLDMGGVIANTRAAGVEGDYWVRDDGVKMYGEYVIAACDVTGAVHNRYDVVQSSLGAAICLDTGGFASADPYQLDIATTW